MSRLGPSSRRSVWRYISLSSGSRGIPENGIALVPAGRDSTIAVSHTQEERLLAGGGRHFPVSTFLRLDGPLDTVALRSACDAAVNRHEGTRISFAMSGSLARIKIADHLPSDYFQEFLLPPKGNISERVARAVEILSDYSEQPFDFVVGPLFRVALVSVSANCFLLGIIMDHIIGDGWSRDIFVRDMLQIYDATVMGIRHDFPDLPIQFPDFAAWERKFLTGNRLTRLVSHWRASLAGVDPIPSSRLIDPNAPGGIPHCRAVNTCVDGSVKRQLDAYIRGTSTTMFALVAAAVKAAIFAMRRESGEDPEGAADVAIMASAANRIQREIRDAFGYFATPIVLRTNLSGNPTLSELFQRESRTTLTALRYQQLPHALLIKHLNPTQYGVRHVSNIDAAPRYVNFDIENKVYREEIRPGGIDVTLVRRPVAAPRGGLRIWGTDSGQKLWISLFYRSDLYSDAWSEQFIDYVENILEGTARDPSRPLQELA
ncbi:condensation domain-containing protein [Streptomyces silvisoli]